jgi:RND family efflux transporter MFP subunit
MKPIKFPARLLVTLAALSLAALVAWQLWVYYMEDPWTRDGTIRADTVDLAPDVSGPVVSVFVQDNQPVHIGDPLFEIDPARFKLAQAQADANAAKTKAAMQDAERTASRYASLSNNAASGQSRDQSSSVAVEAQADYAQAQANQAIAALNLERTTVRATVNGIVTNVSLRPGDYATAGTPVIAIVDTDSLYVDGYFEETKLGRIAVGDPARVTLLDGAPPLTGHVTGIAAAITDAERTASPNLLANVNPTFTWVRLARRVPVRIALDHVPPHTILVAGMTCTVAISH